jgi:hypothetical protein
MRWPRKGSMRAAAWFVTGLCLMELVSSLIRPPGTGSISIAFLCFLPIVFFMIASEHEQAEKTILELRERVEALESGATAGNGSKEP